MRFGTRSGRMLMASIVLVAFASRMLIPQGFMPASGRPFLMQICAEGLSAEMLADLAPARAGSMDMDMMSMPMDPMPVQDAHHHSGSPAHVEHCIFGTVCGAGPVPHLPLANAFLPAAPLRAQAVASLAGPARLVHLPQARAPPSRLS